VIARHSRGLSSLESVDYILKSKLYLFKIDHNILSQLRGVGCQVFLSLPTAPAGRPEPCGGYALKGTITYLFLDTEQNSSKDGSIKLICSYASSLVEYLSPGSS